MARDFTAHSNARGKNTANTQNALNFFPSKSTWTMRQLIKKVKANAKPKGKKLKGENLMKNLILKYAKMDETDKQKKLKKFARATPSEQRDIIQLKSEFYMRSENEQDKKDCNDLRKRAPREYERLCFCIAVDALASTKKSDKTKALIKNEKLNLRAEKRKIKFIDKIRPLYSEIHVYRENNMSWANIVKVLKSSHRSMFKDFKITPSYLRRTYEQVAPEEKLLPKIKICTPKVEIPPKAEISQEVEEPPKEETSEKTSNEPPKVNPQYMREEIYQRPQEQEERKRIIVKIPPEKLAQFHD